MLNFLEFLMQLTSSSFRNFIKRKWNFNCSYQVPLLVIFIKRKWNLYNFRKCNLYFIFLKIPLSVIYDYEKWNFISHYQVQLLVIIIKRKCNLYNIGKWNLYFHFLKIHFLLSTITKSGISFAAIRFHF